MRRCRLASVWLAIAALAAAGQGQELSVDELIALDLDELAAVAVVAASKRAQPADEAPGTVRVITASQIRQRGYLTLEDALADLPGFQFRDLHGFNSYVFVRGAPSQNNLILLLVNGVQVNELNSGGFYGGAQYNLANVERIEVVYGPVSALYGTNAVSGVVNLVTRAPDAGDQVVAGGVVGSFDTARVYAAVTEADVGGGFGLNLAGLYSTSDTVDLGGAAGDDNWSDEVETFEHDLAVDGTVTWRSFRLDLLLHDKRAARATNYRSTGTEYLDRGSEWHIRFVTAALAHRLELDRRWSLLSRATYRTTTVRDDTIAWVSSDEGQVGHYRPGAMAGLEEQLAWRLRDDLDLVAGVSWESERLAEDFSVTASGSPDLAPPTPPRPPEVSTRLVSGYVQGQYRPLAGLELTAGVRHDQSSVYGPATTPRLGAVVEHRQLTVKLLYAEAFRAPEPWDLTSGLGNPELEPEDMRSLELAALWRLSDTVVVDGALYRNHLDGLFQRQITQVGERWVNGGKVVTDGAEIGAQVAVARFRGFASYTFTDSLGEEQAAVREIARHGGVAGLTWMLAHGIEVGLRAAYLGRRRSWQVIEATGSDWIDDAVVVDATVAVARLAGLDLRLTVRNLFDHEYYHSSNRPPARYRQPQRGMYLAVERRF